MNQRFPIIGTDTAPWQDHISFKLVQTKRSLLHIHYKNKSQEPIWVKLQLNHSEIQCVYLEEITNMLPGQVKTLELTCPIGSDLNEIYQSGLLVNAEVKSLGYAGLNFV